MKKIKNLLYATVFSVVLFLPAKSFAQNTQDFSFQSFDADYYLQKEPDNSSSMAINETLVAQFPTFDQNHGILRAVPAVYNGHDMHISGLSVTQDGQPAQYSSSKQNDNLVLKIGSPSTYVHGDVTYKINYTLHDVIKPYADHDELFWDINGDQWPQTFSGVKARVHVPALLAKSMQERQKCYEGTFGSLAQNCTIIRSDADNESLITVSAANVGANQTLSVVLGFQPGTFTLSQTVLKDQQKHKTEIIGAVTLAAVPPIFALFFMFSRWRAFGNDPKGRGVIIPEYEPPKGFDVINSDFLLKQKLRNIAISATLIEQAVKGNLTLIEIPKQGLFGKKDYELLLNKPPENNGEEANEILQAIFRDGLISGSRVKVSSFKSDYSLQSGMYKSLKKIEKSLANNLFQKGFFKRNPKTVLDGYRIWGSVLIIIPAFAAGALGLLGVVGIGAAVGLALAGVIVFIFSFIMPARTEVGVRAHDDLLGLKNYIKLAEADRIKFLQSPEGAEKLPVAEQFAPKTPEAKVKLFEKLLPYAMLFGLEKDWAKQFEGIYNTAPGWYQGGSWTAFNTGYLIGSLDDFNTASSMSFASPSSSSGSGFSGGGAGGGGGGGGGGGW
jgi:uncharacterized membrane protein YgcG